jgi:hypothetical protein
MSQQKGKPSNNKKKEIWYPVVSKSSILKMLRGQGILSDWWNIPKPALEAMELDVLEFINRHCRVEQIKKKSNN